MLVVGPTAANIEVLLGNYYGISDSFTTLLEGLISRAPEGIQVEYRAGSTLAQPATGTLGWSVFQAANSDITIACMGLSPQLEGEEGDAILSDQNGDRTSIALPANQVNYLKQIASGGAKIVLVLTGGSPVELGELEDMVDAIVWVWYPGQEGGKAVADILFGNVSPAGKLPLTFPKNLGQLPPFEDYSMADRTYRYTTQEPLFPFGFGLSYATFNYSNLAVSKPVIQSGESLTASVTVGNAGKVNADEVVQVYLSDLEASVIVPIHKLIAFKRVRLAAGEKKELSFTISPEMMQIVDNDGKLILEPGKFHLAIGGCSPSQRGLDLGAASPVTATFIVQ